MTKLERLRVENLALISLAELELDEGLNVLTGETGAGKTMLAKALEVLLGAKAPREVVRPGAEAAYIEAEFAVDGDLELSAEMEEIIADNPGQITLARRIAAEGRSRCMVNGRTVSLEALRLIAGRLVAFYGQHEGRKLMMERTQVELLDRSGDGRGSQLLLAYNNALRQARSDSRELTKLEHTQASDDREVELARFELQEIEELEPRQGEEAELITELSFLSGAEEGRQVCVRASAELGSEGGALEFVSRVGSDMRRHEESMGLLPERVESVRLELEDIVSEIDGLGARWAADPERQRQVEERLATYQRLSRKHITSADGLIDTAAELRQKVDKVDAAPQLIKQAQERCRVSLEAAEQSAAKLSRWRAEQAGKLSAAIVSLLRELAMEEAAFEIVLEPLPGQGLARLSETGAERVVFYLQANPGIPAQPIDKVASGGEVSRLMLALVSEAGIGEQALLVLDEPDVGIGGNTAHGVGTRLSKLAESTQLLVISHLPQIAAKANRHFHLSKQSDGQTTHTTLRSLSEDERLDELCRMSGYSPDDTAAREAAQALLS